MIESKAQILVLLESNLNTSVQTTFFLTPYNQSSREDEMNEPIFYINVPAVIAKEKRGEKKRKKI